MVGSCHEWRHAQKDPGAQRWYCRGVESGDGGDDVKNGGLTMVSPSNMVVKTHQKIEVVGEPPAILLVKPLFFALKPLKTQLPVGSPSQNFRSRIPPIPQGKLKELQQRLVQQTWLGELLGFSAGTSDILWLFYIAMV